MFLGGEISLSQCHYHAVKTAENRKKRQNGGVESPKLSGLIPVASNCLRLKAIFFICDSETFVVHAFPFPRKFLLKYRMQFADRGEAAFKSVQLSQAKIYDHRIIMYRQQNYQQMCPVSNKFL